MEDEWTTVKDTTKKKKKPQQQQSNSVYGGKKGGLLVAGAVAQPQGKYGGTSNTYGGSDKYGGNYDDYGDEWEEQKDYSNKGASAVAEYDFGIDREETFKWEKVSNKCAKAVSAARQAKNMTQGQLATKVNEKIHTIVDVENATAKYNADLINRIEKALQTQIPRHRKKAK